MPSELNLLLALDKPVGCTSHDVVARVRRALGERRVGHAGTLDPLASGVMVIGVGQATRLLGRLTLDRKRYVARVAFGAETNTDDAEGEVTRRADPSADLRSAAFARQLLAEFVGEQEQVPPAFSAISVGGVRSYRRARAGEEVELPARTIVVHAADLVAIDEVDGHAVWTVAFDVSKGTYIRSLARDLGRAAGNAAHIADLRRTASGSISIGACVALEGLDAAAARASALDPVAVLGTSAATLTDAALADVLHGRTLDPGALGIRVTDAHKVPIALVHGGELRALARLQDGRLRMEDVFPQGIEGVRA